MVIFIFMLPIGPLQTCSSTRCDNDTSKLKRLLPESALWSPSSWRRMRIASRNMKPGIFFDTLQESFRNKMFLFFFVVSSLVIGSIALAMNMDVVNGAMRGVTFLGNEIRLPAAFTVQQWVQNLQAGLAMFVATIGLMLALLATSTLFS